MMNNTKKTASDFSIRRAGGRISCLAWIVTAALMSSPGYAAETTARPGSPGAVPSEVTPAVTPPTTEPKSAATPAPWRESWHDDPRDRAQILEQIEAELAELDARRRDEAEVLLRPHGGMSAATPPRTEELKGVKAELEREKARADSVARELSAARDELTARDQEKARADAMTRDIAGVVGQLSAAKAIAATEINEIKTTLESERAQREAVARDLASVTEQLASAKAASSAELADVKAAVEREKARADAAARDLAAAADQVALGRGLRRKPPTRRPRATRRRPPTLPQPRRSTRSRLRSKGKRPNVRPWRGTSHR